MRGRSGRSGKAAAALVALMAAAIAVWAYSYYHAQDFTTGIGTQWQMNGTVNSSGLGLQGAGSLISQAALPTGNDYEVKTTLRVTGNGGYFNIYLRASNDALAPSQGSYYNVELVSPTFSGGGCSALLNVDKRFNGNLTSLGSVQVGCGDYMTIRAIAVGPYVGVWVNGVYVIMVNDPDLPAGRPGVGVYAVPGGIQRADIGHYDIEAPNPASVTVSAFPGSVGLRWNKPTDPSTFAGDGGTGSGPGYFQVFRNGALLTTMWSASIPGQVVEFIDWNVTPGTTYSYDVYTVDYHFNGRSSLVSVTTPASSYDTRQVGVKALGTYWGAGPE